jgi:hypothetical protein
VAAVRHLVIDALTSQQQRALAQISEAITACADAVNTAHSHTGMWSAYPGGKILVLKFGLRQLLDRLDELLASSCASRAVAAA